MKAAIYLRISQDATGEQAGVSRQQEDCLALVAGQKWNIHETYIDNDISASSGKPRPGYRQMLADIQLGHIDAVVAWHPDRLYRKLGDLEELINAIEARNVVMRTVRAGEIDLATPTGRMLARILSATAQAEGEIKSDRWKRSWRQGREAGQVAHTGTRLFGYTRDGQVVPEEAEIARQMVADVLAGVTIVAITRDLDARDIKTTRGGQWRPGTVRQYIANPKIAGLSTLKGEVVAEGAWEPIIDRATWDDLSAFTSARTRPYAPRKALLNGLIFCGRCQTRLITGSYGRGKRIYRCPDRAGMNGCGGVAGMAEPIEQIAEAFAQERLSDARVQARVADLRANPALKHAEIAELSLRIGELEHELDNPGTPVAAILRAIDRAKEKREALMREASARIATPLDRLADWPTDLRRRRALVDLTIGRIELLPADRSRGARLGFDNERVKIDPR